MPPGWASDIAFIRAAGDETVGVRPAAGAAALVCAGGPAKQMLKRHAGRIAVSGPWPQVRSRFRVIGGSVSQAFFARSLALSAAVDSVATELRSGGRTAWPILIC